MVRIMKSKPATNCSIQQYGTPASVTEVLPLSLTVQPLRRTHSLAFKLSHNQDLTVPHYLIILTKCWHDWIMLVSQYIHPTAPGRLLSAGHGHVPFESTSSSGESKLLAIRSQRKLSSYHQKGFKLINCCSFRTTVVHVPFESTSSSGESKLPVIRSRRKLSSYHQKVFKLINCYSFRRTVVHVLF